MPKNKKEEPLRAKVIGLWGDPGLTEYYNFDFLSRFLLVLVAPYNEIPCNRDAGSIVKLVLRPRSLWIDSVGDQRKDFFGNLNKQLRDAANPAAGGKNAANYAHSNIMPITQSYKVGDELTLNRLHEPLAYGYELGYPNRDKRVFEDEADIFSSKEAFVATTLMSDTYKNSSGVPALSTANVYSYIHNPSLGTANKPNLKIVINSNGAGGIDRTGYSKSFEKILISSEKYSEFIASPGLILAKLVGGLIADRGGLFGRYVFNSVEYIDSNAENRQRSQDAGCIPLIVASPSTFPTPVNRNLGGVNITL